MSRRARGGISYLDGNNIMGGSALAAGAGDRERFLAIPRHPMG